MSLATLLTLLALAIVGVLIVDFVRSYVAATSTGWQRLWDAGRGSATMVVAQLGAVVALITAVSDHLADWISSLLGDPAAADSVKSAIQSYVTPATVGTAMLVFSGLVAWARLRTLSKPSA
ncbi:MAG TPA: hypothetical protein VFA53_02435 [Xanthobacteraceae bacterium]|nr:hypothetical protein [Xanthobacteraceae bacterium]